ncbi:MAG: 2'-5' RNA ligase family protein [Chthoniobacterales bacterium]
MKSANERIAFWLLPAASEQKFLAELIQDLALRFDAPVFAPHLTLHGGGVDPTEPLKALSRIRAQSSYQLEVAGLDFSERYTKTLFIRFALTGELAELRGALGEALHLSRDESYDPHLSLLYKEMPLSKKAGLASTIEIPFRHVIFDAIGVVAHPAEIKNRDDVAAWRMIGRRSLAESTR